MKNQEAGISEWKECNLGNHVFINKRSIDKNYTFKEIEYLDTGSITKGKIESLQHFKLADAPSRAKRIIKDNDIVLSMVRPIQSHYGFLKKTEPNMLVSTGFVVLTSKESIDPYFVYAFLTQDDITDYLDAVAEGSTSAYPAFTPDVIENLSIILPPLPEQRAIAGVLSSLDAKIDLLHRQNKMLEGMAEALWLKEVVDKLSLKPYVKTSGKTGLHIYVPIVRNLDYKAVRSAAETIGRFVLQGHPSDITMEWAVEKRKGKVFVDYNQNVRGKTLAAAYSPRPAAEATVSTPLRWNELGKVYPY